MSKYIQSTIGLLSALAVFAFFTLPAGAVPNAPSFHEADLDTPGTNQTLVLPEQAGDSPVISLGTAVDPNTGRTVEGFAIIHPKRGYHHKPGHDKGGGPGNGGGGDDGGDTSSCFAFLSKGANWKSVESWVVNPANTEGLTDSFVFDTLSDAIGEWEDAADGSVDSVLGADILGDGSVTTDTLVADTESPDGVNEVYFGDVSSDGAIGVTIVWGIFRGPPRDRELVEWDQIYDQEDFDWSATGEAGKMDFENIAQHELGHSIGLGHPDDSCTEETMYAFADNGETKKRDLNAGDIAGTDELY